MLNSHFWMEMFLDLQLIVYTFRSAFVLLEYVLRTVNLKSINRSLTAKLFTQGYLYHKLQKHFILISILSHSELTGKYNVGVKTLMLQGILEPLFYDV